MRMKLIFNCPRAHAITYILFDGLTYNTRGYFASCVVFSEPRRGEEKYEQWAKCPRVLYVKPSIRRFIILLQKGVILIQFYLVRVFLKRMRHLSFRALANDVNSIESQPNLLYLIV